MVITPYVVTPAQLHLDYGSEQSEFLSRLSTAENHDLPITPTLIIPPLTLKTFLAENNVMPFLHSHLRQINLEDSTALAQFVSLFQRKFSVMPFPPSLAKAISSAYKLQLHGHYFYLTQASSINSSQLTTVDHFEKGDSNLLQSLRSLWVTNINPKMILESLSSHYLSSFSNQTIIIQALPPTSYSGSVSTTTSPAEKNRLTVEIVSGLGVLCRPSLATPSQYVLDKSNFDLVRRHLFSHQSSINLDRHGHLHTKIMHQPVEPPIAVITRIAQLGVKLQHLFARPVKASFTLEKNNLQLHTIIDDFLLPASPSPTMNTPSTSPQKRTKAGAILAHGLPISPGITQASAVKIQAQNSKPESLSGKIIIVPTASIEYLPFIRFASGIISQKGGVTSHLAIVARELGIPMISNVDPVTQDLIKAEAILLDGSTGTISASSKHFSTPPIETDNAPLPITATKIFINLSEANKAFEVSRLPVDGVGALYGKHLLGQFLKHPQHIHTLKQSKSYWQTWSNSVKQIAETFGDRPVYYVFADLPSNEMSRLVGSSAYEVNEPNPFFGYRGALRQLSNPSTLIQELTLINSLRTKESLLNLHLILPFVRTPLEYRSLKRLLSAHGITRHAGLEIFVSLDTPSSVLSLPEFAALGVDGFSLNLDHFLPTFLSLDPQNPDLTPQLDPRLPALNRLLQNLLESSIQLRLKSNVRGALVSSYPDLMKLLVEWGIYSITTDFPSFKSLKNFVHQAESHHVTKTMPGLKNYY